MNQDCDKISKEGVVGPGYSFAGFIQHIILNTRIEAESLQEVFFLPK